MHGAACGVALSAVRGLGCDSFLSHAISAGCCVVVLLFAVLYFFSLALVQARFFGRKKNREKMFVCPKDSFLFRQTPPCLCFAL